MGPYRDTTTHPAGKPKLIPARKFLVPFDVRSSHARAKDGWLSEIGANGPATELPPLGSDRMSREELYQAYLDGAIDYETLETLSDAEQVLDLAEANLVVAEAQYAN